LFDETAKDFLFFERNDRVEVQFWHNQRWRQGDVSVVG
jgi:hypothetical protein